MSKSLKTTVLNGLGRCIAFLAFLLICVYPSLYKKIFFYFIKCFSKVVLKVKKQNYEIQRSKKVG